MDRPEIIAALTRLAALLEARALRGEMYVVATQGEEIRLHMLPAPADSAGSNPQVPRVRWDQFAR